MRLEIPVWQFVRIMVRLEERGRGRRSRAPGSAYAAWRSRWQKLDRRLAKLGQSDADAFADLMMRQEVVIEETTVAQIREVVSALDEVGAQLKAAIDKGGEPKQINDLRFEHKELTALRTRLHKGLRR